MKTVAMYTVKPPNKDQYYAAVIADDMDNLYVYSTKTGTWEKDPTMHHADLMFPQYDYNEWDIYPLESPDQAKVEQPKVEKSFRDQNPDVAKHDDNDDDDDNDRLSELDKRYFAAVDVEKGDTSSSTTAAGDPDAGGLTQYLDMVSNIEKGSGFTSFIREHGKSYAFDEDSFVGGGVSQQCFKNAADAAMANPDLTYVEGYISVHGVPVHHAWTVDKAGKVMDPTVSDPEGKLGYYGVPFTKRYLIDTMLETEHYGLMTDHSAEKTVFGDVTKMVKK